MIFELVTFAKVKLHPPSFIMRSVIHQAMTHLIFVVEAGKLGGGMCIGRSLTKTVEMMCDKKIRSNKFTVDNFYKKCTYNIGV